MNFIIIGDKYQKGMKSRGCAGLIKLNQKSVTIFENQYTIIKKYFPLSNIVYVGGFESKKIENFLNKNYSDVVFVNNANYENYNDAYSISLVKDYLVDQIFITFGYTVLNKKIFDKFDANLGSQVFISSDSSSSIGCVIDNHKIENFSFDLPNTIEDLYFLSDNDTKYLYQILLESKYKNYFIFELLNHLIDTYNIIIKPIKSKNYEYSK